jgi:hypothetical protein
MVNNMSIGLLGLLGNKLKVNLNNGEEVSPVLGNQTSI